MRRGIALWPLIVILALGALAWNGSRFIGTVPKPRAKALDFLPSPVVAQALSLGQPSVLAKLRWIDSFAYFQLQIERQDDRVAGADARGGFERLYDTLISLDPLFLPFYEHAVLNTSGVLKQHRAGLSFIMRGLLAHPRESSLWRLASAELSVSFAWAKRNPQALERWLGAWAEAEPSEEGKQLVRDWQRGLAFTNVEGLEALPYWLEQLRSTAPGTPLSTYVEDTVRELLAQHGTIVLPTVIERELLPWAPLRADPVAVAQRWPRGIPAWAPIAADGSLRPDPYGWPWRRSGDRVISPGQEHLRFGKRVQGLRLAVQAEADKRGRPPRDLAEAKAWGFDVPEPPTAACGCSRKTYPRCAGRRRRRSRGSCAEERGPPARRGNLRSGPEARAPLPPPPPLLLPPLRPRLLA